MLPLSFGGREIRRENWSVNVLTTATTILWQYIVPGKCRLRMLGFGNYLGTVAAWGTAYWQGFSNSVPILLAGAYQVFDQVGYAAQRQAVTEDIYGGGALLQIYGTNPTLATLAMGISIEYELIFQE